MNPPESETSTVNSFYDAGYETSRLDQGVAQLEAVRTRELLARFLPAAPAVVLDVGGGAGAHAFWIAERGYAVHLSDSASRLVSIAAERSATYGLAHGLYAQHGFEDLVRRTVAD